MKALLASLALTCVAMPGAIAQSLKNPAVEGLMFLTNNAFSDPNESARPLEYRSAAGNDKITLIVTREGRNLRLPSSDISLIVPYPGRSGFQKKEALALCDLALQRFPQHERLLKNIRFAWARVTRADYLAYESYSTARQTAMNGAMDTMAADAQRVQENNAYKPRERTPTLLDKPKPTPTPKITPKDLETPDPANPPDLDDSLEAVRKLYEQLNKSTGE